MVGFPRQYNASATFAARHSRPRRGLLRTHQERACDRRNGKCDELLPLHSITSSARARSVGGTVMPSALAVLRLITKSNLVGCSTGRSAGFGALKDLVYVGSGPPPEIKEARPVTHQAASCYMQPVRIHRRQPVLRRKVSKPCSMHRKHRVSEYKECPHALPGHSPERMIEIFGPARVHEQKLHSQRAGGSFEIGYHGRVVWIRRVRKDGNMSNVGDELPEQLQVFAKNFRTDAVG